MGFWLLQKLMTLDDLEHQFTAVIRVMRILTKRLSLESRGFRYKVALYLSYLHIKFDDKTKGNPFEFLAYFSICLRLKLNWRLCLALFAARFLSYWV